MAKLNGVKTLDMANGEITKVAYEGVEYTKVDGSAEEGDLLLSNEDLTDINAGDYFLVLSEEKFLDNAGDLRSSDAGFDYTFFRKISAQSKPTLEQRVGALESDVAALKGEKVSKETIEFEGATYRKVEREAREGDVVVLTGDDLPRWFTKGKAYKIIVGPYIGKCDEGYEDYKVYDAEYGRTRETVDVYEPVMQAKYVPQDGDIVVITGNTSRHANKIGDIGKVGKEEPLADGGVKVYVPEGPTYAIRTKPQDIRKATPAEVEKYKQAVKDAETAEKWAKIGRKPNEFKKGDVLSYKYGNEPICYYKVTRIDGDKVYYDCHEFGNDEEFSWKDDDGIQLVAPVESLFNA